MVQTGMGVETAFALNCAAGFATVLGGMVIFSKRLVHLANPISLAIALSLSAGVMLFISLVEMFGKSVQLIMEGVQTATMTHDTASGYGWLGATACFTVGIGLIYAIDLVVHGFAPDTAVVELATLDNLRDSFNHNILETSKSPDYLEAQAPGFALRLDEAARAQLNRMGILSALAIGIHNMPEGIATYVGAMRNSAVGASLAIGIGLHNIPEGIAVATPIYFSTGSRWRAIMWCCISASAEPLGGVIAWLAVGDGMKPMSEGILLGVVCGIMVCICIKELLPTAFKFSKGRTHLVARGVYAGMYVMVTSLILFAFVGV
jgi:ZIP family zinc transporter